MESWKREQEHERRVDTGRLGRRLRPAAATRRQWLHERILARGLLEDSLHESSGVRYGDTRTGPHVSGQRVGRAFAEPPT